MTAQQTEKPSAKKIASDVLAVLSAAEMHGAALRLTGTLDRSLYQQTNKVLEAAGGKWDRKVKAHLFGGDAADIIEPILLTGEIVIGKSAKQEFGIFFSPPTVVERVAQLAMLEPHHRVLEPSAGHGALARMARGFGCKVECHDINPAHVDQLRRDNFVAHVDDFLAVGQVAIFDRVVMNPPFARQADIDHVTHALGFLKPGGLLVSVMAVSATFRQDKKAVAFRDLVSERGGNFEILPEGSFKESGTSVNTCIVVIPGASHV